MKNGFLHELVITPENIGQAIPVLSVGDVKNQIMTKDVGYARQSQLVRFSVFCGPIKRAGVEYFIKDITGKITFDEAYDSGINESVFEQEFNQNYYEIVKNVVSNPESLVRYLRRDVKIKKELQDVKLLAADLKKPGVKIKISKDSLYRIDAKDLLKAIRRRSCAVEDIQLYNQGQPVPIKIIDENSDGIFENEDKVIFYGLAGTGKYSVENVYWINARKGKENERIESLDTVSGEDVAVLKTVSSSFIMEKDDEMYTEGEIMKGQKVYWLWQEVTFDKGLDHSFDLNDFSEESESAELILDIFKEGRRNISAKIKVSINGQIEEIIEFKGKGQVQNSVSVPADSLKESGNKISIKLMKDEEINEKLIPIIYVDSINLRYPRKAKYEKGDI